MALLGLVTLQAHNSNPHHKPMELFFSHKKKKTLKKKAKQRVSIWYQIKEADKRTNENRDEEDCNFAWACVHGG